MRQVIVLPHIKVHNANALSSPYTIGFPAMTAWLGAVHALQRHLNEEFEELEFKGTAVACHSIQLKTYKGESDYVSSIIGTANPLVPDKKCQNKWNAPFVRPPFVEEARCSLDSTLVIEYSGIDQDKIEEFFSMVEIKLHSRMKIAGGDILAFKSPEIVKIDNAEKFFELRRKLMPGYILVERRDLMQPAMEHGRDCIDALLDYLKIYHKSSEPDKDGQSIWESTRKAPGWIVPIATGFHGIAPIGPAKNQRDQTTPHRFAESVVTLGEFLMSYRIQNLDEMLWHYSYYPQANLYLCEQEPNNN